MNAVVRTLRRSVSGVFGTMVQSAARAYIAGPTLEDALRVRSDMTTRGFPTTLGMWEGPEDTPRGVLTMYLDAVRALAGLNPDSYLSVKLCALDFSTPLVEEVLRRGKEQGVRIHFDALGARTVDQTWSILDSLVADPQDIGCTLPGRWQRSVSDADLVNARQWAVRVVKGEWPEPDDRATNQELREGYLAVIDRLAGRARHVSVATHDVPLAKEAIRRLRANGTSCDLELLYGLPDRELIRFAATEEVAVRIYVPYGTAFLPYALERIGRRPRLVWWLFKDAMSGAFQRLHTT